MPITPGARSDARTDRFLICLLRTWLFLMCLARTAFLRMSLGPIFETAYEVPLSATNSAIMATTLAKLRCERSLLNK